MKQTAQVWVQAAFSLALLAGTSLTTAQHGSNESELREVRTTVAQALDRPAADIVFEEFRLVRDKLGTVVCGTADGKRFLAGPAGKPPPQIEGALNTAMFNYMWNARCGGMSASAAEDAFRRELK